MKIVCHDAHYSFDYVAWVNAVFDKCVATEHFKQFTSYNWGISPGVMAKFWRYEKVSLPTMLQIEFGSGVQMWPYVIKID